MRGNSIGTGERNYARDGWIDKQIEPSRFTLLYFTVDKDYDGLLILSESGTKVGSLGLSVSQ